MWNGRRRYSVRWGGFALLILALTLRSTLNGYFNGNIAPLLQSLGMTTAIFGLVAYAAGLQLGPRLFWRVFCPAYSLYAVGDAMMILNRLSRAAPLPLPVVAAYAAILGFIAIGLLRYAGWLRDPRTADPTRYEAVFS